MFSTFFVLLTIAVLSTPALAERTVGTLMEFNAKTGKGFLRTVDGEELKVRASALSGSCNGKLREGQAVEFDIVEDPIKKRKAKNVTCRERQTQIRRIDFVTKS
jgi:cold shock CspA family protein